MTRLLRLVFLTLGLLGAVAACTQITPEQREAILHKANWHGTRAS